MIQIHINKACAHLCSPPEVLTAGMAKAVRVEFAFSSDWDGLTKTAVFSNGRATVDVLAAKWDGDTVDVPPEVLAVAGRYARVGVYGTNASGVVLPTVWVSLGKVQPAAEPSGDPSTDPTLPVWAQLREIIGDLNNLTTKAKENLVAAINEAAKTGSGGAGSIDLRTADGYIQYSNDGGETWENLIALADLKGEKGDTGAPGPQGAPGEQGPQGETGPAGPQGKTGPAGQDGAPGKDGSPGKDGADGKDGKTPVKGTDYFTQADKQEIAEDAAALVDLSGKQNKITASGLLKGDGAGGVSMAEPGTDYLTEAPVTSVNGATGEVKSTFYVTVTQGDDDSVTADKTAAEVYEAYAAGYAVYAVTKFPAVDVAFELPLVSAAPFFETFVLGFGALGSLDPTANPQYPTVAYTGTNWLAWLGTLAKESDIPAELKNPYSLNIKIGDTTTSYDGSAAKTVEIPKGVPSVSAADNGKFLRVVSGAWAAAAINNANGGSF